MRRSCLKIFSSVYFERILFLFFPDNVMVNAKNKQENSYFLRIRKNVKKVLSISNIEICSEILIAFKKTLAASLKLLLLQKLAPLECVSCQNNINCNNNWSTHMVNITGLDIILTSLPQSGLSYNKEWINNLCQLLLSSRQLVLDK